jgi:hypothetical protein
VGSVAHNTQRVSERRAPGPVIVQQQRPHIPLQRRPLRASPNGPQLKGRIASYMSCTCLRIHRDKTRAFPNPHRKWPPIRAAEQCRTHCERHHSRIHRHNSGRAGHRTAEGNDADRADSAATTPPAAVLPQQTGEGKNRPHVRESGAGAAQIRQKALACAGQTSRGKVLRDKHLSDTRTALLLSDDHREGGRQRRQTRGEQQREPDHLRHCAQTHREGLVRYFRCSRYKGTNLRAEHRQHSTAQHRV